MGMVLFPVGALVMEIGAQKIVDTLAAMPHLSIGWPGRIIPLIMLARPRQGRQRLVDGRAPGNRRWFSVGGERQLRRPSEWRAHQSQRAEYIGPHQRAPRRDRRTEIVPDDRGGAAIAEGKDETQDVAHCVQKAEGSKLSIVIGAPAGRTA